MFFDDDICYCMNECSNEDCMRNKCHMNTSGIYTMGLLKDTEYCPLYSEVEKEEGDE